MTNNQPELKACELLPCPFCSTGYIETSQLFHAHKQTNLNIEACPLNGIAWNLNSQNFAAWNTRADLTPKWQSMDSCPRDGTYVILGKIITTTVRTTVLCWVTKGSFRADKNDWYGDAVDGRLNEPTHWIPIPPPPATATKEIENEKTNPSPED